MSKAPRKQLAIKSSIQDQFLFACRDDDVNRVNDLLTNGIQVNQANESCMSEWSFEGSQNVISSGGHSSKSSG